MATSLKDANRLPLFACMAANLAVYYTAVKTDTIFGGDWLSLAKEIIEAVPAGLGLVLVGILNAQIPADMKARLVFHRWRNPLPGSRAFTQYGKNDPRVDLSALEQQHGPLPNDEEAQNAFWFKLFKSIENHPSVLQAHREYLFTRDFTVLSLLMLVVLGVSAAIQMLSHQTTMIYTGLLFLQFILAGQAARNHGKRLVTTVLALKGTGD